MRIVAHRGASACEPENTLRAFARAVEFGAGAVELDVWRTADGKLAVIHDATVDRTTNGVGRVEDLTLEDIQRLRIGAGERVPSLEEVVAWAAGRTFLHIELKSPAAAEPVAALAAARLPAGSCRISSFWHDAVRQAKDAAPALETGVTWSGSPVDPVRLARDARADAMHVEYPFVTPALVAAARAAGLRVLAWTVDGAREIEAMAALGVEDLVTNVPDVARRVLQFLEERRAPPRRETTPEDAARDAERARLQAMMRERPGNPEGPRRPGPPPKW